MFVKFAVRMATQKALSIIENKTKLTIYGYVRWQITHFKLTMIPSDIVHIILWYFYEYDKWDKVNINENVLIFHENVLIHKHHNAGKDAA